ncbi:alpha/beta fold hydrolase [Streptomyces parvulus]|uniref:Alpha/beta hydrolase n=1 Tax=Streptomyces parvulus TaxID=146923 RepID=A0A369UXU3_9ACTN|nr:alpha/beta hydrolase [Streptomyces parvulus]RDD85297.1 alpha/beta hydrolase [Streptomyces parvulus]
MIRKNRVIGALVAFATAATVLFTTGLTDETGRGSTATSVDRTTLVKSARDGGDQSGVTSHFAKVNGFRMHYLRAGSGSPVVLVHGFPQTSAEWRPQMEALAREHTVIAVDLRGTGDSDVPKKGYDTVQLADDVHTLLAQLGLNENVQMVAHDIGVWVAYPYLAKWGDEVSRAVVMEGPIVDESIYSFPSLAPSGGLYVWHHGFFQKKLAEQLVRGHEHEFVKGFVDQYLGVKKAFDSADYEYYARFLREPGRFAAWMKMYRSLDQDVAQTKQLSSQGKLDMPILAIGGSEALGSGVGDQWSKYGTDVESKVLAGSGHWVTEEKPRELTDMLLGFLR